MRQVRKGGKSEKEAISRVEKKHYKTICESRQSFKYHTLLRRGSQLSTVCFIIARAAADGPGPVKPDRKRKGNLCQIEYVLTYTLCVLTYISLYLYYHWSG